jgi:hypothetical protein
MIVLGIISWAPTCDSGRACKLLIACATLRRIRMPLTTTSLIGWIYLILLLLLLLLLLKIVNFIVNALGICYHYQRPPVTAAGPASC